ANVGWGTGSGRTAARLQLRFRRRHGAASRPTWTASFQRLRSFARSRGRHANSGFAVSRELGAKDAQLALSQIVELFWQRGLWNARDLFYYAETSIELR